MTGGAAEAWTSDETYEPYVGRWSRLVAPEFLRRLPAAPPAAWCDVGCGAGTLAHAILATESSTAVLGVDPSRACLAAARRGAARPLRGADLRPHVSRTRRHAGDRAEPTIFPGGR